jgi:hypothetical protein
VLVVLYDLRNPACRELVPEVCGSQMGLIGRFELPLTSPPPQVERLAAGLRHEPSECAAAGAPDGSLLSEADDPPSSHLASGVLISRFCVNPGGGPGPEKIARFVTGTLQVRPLHAAERSLLAACRQSA